MNINAFCCVNRRNPSVFLKSRVTRIIFITRFIYCTNNTGSGSGVRRQIVSAKFNSASASDSFPPRHHPRTWQEHASLYLRSHHLLIWSTFRIIVEVNQRLSSLQWEAYSIFWQRGMESLEVLYGSYDADLKKKNVVNLRGKAEEREMAVWKW